MVITIISTIFVFGLLVLFHEFGHFITAKFTGMRVDEFAIGFGPKLFSKKYGETKYSLRALPLGGFNDIAGMDATDNPAGERGFCEKPVLSRMIVILAGSFMNFVLPIILFFGIYATVGVGKPSVEPVIGGVIDDFPAARAGLQVGDKILTVDGEKVATWEDFLNKVKTLETERAVTLTYERNSQVTEILLTPQFDEKSKRILIGVQNSIIYEPQSIGVAFISAVTHTKDIMIYMINALADIFKAPSNAELAGPIGIAKMAGQAAETGLISLLNFAALLSLNLGIINLLPVPALDGGHFVNLVIEAVRGKPMSQKALMYTQRAGMALLLLLTLYATTSDLARVFFGR